MPHLKLSNPTICSCDYEVYLSNPFNTTYYKELRITSTNYGSSTSNVSGYVVSVTAKSSSSQYVIGKVNDGMSAGKTYLLYAYAQAQNGTWYLAGSHSITMKTTSTNYAMYPCRKMYITADYYDSYAHYDHSKGYITGDPYDWPWDDNCGDTGRSYIYCPCNEMTVTRIHGVGGSGVNTIWLRSTSKVELANGTKDYLVMMVIHPNDDTLQGINVGKIYTRGQAMFLEGNDGPHTGYHFHISLGLGAIEGNGWRNVPDTEYYVIYTSNDPIKPEDALFINTDFTTVLYDAGLNFKYKS